MNVVTSRYVFSASPIKRNYFLSDDLLNKIGSLANKKLPTTKIRRAFKYIDTDNSGGISLREFQNILTLLNINLHHSMVSIIFEHVDRSFNDTMELHEFQKFLQISARPKNQIRCDFDLNLAHPSLLLRYHIWHVKNRPFTFTLSPGSNNISAYFQVSSNPEMTRSLKQGARLFYINNAPVENATYPNIESILSSIQCPFILVFQNLNTKNVRKPGELNVFKDINFEGWPNLLSPSEKNLFYDPSETLLESESTAKDSSIRVLQYYNHCRHCPYEEAWYLHVHLTMEDENYSFTSNALTHVIMLLIALSTFTYVFQTLPDWEDWGGWHPLEGVISVSFTLEFAIRILSCRSIRIYMEDPMNIVDFCAVIPYWLELASSRVIQPELLRVVRVIRLLRLVRLAKSRSLSEILTIYRITCENSIQWLIMFMSLGFVLSIVVASFIFISEVGDENIYGSCSDMSDDDFCMDDTVDVLYDNLTTYFKSGAECQSSCAEFGEMGCCRFYQTSGMCQFFNSSVYMNKTNSSSPSYSSSCITEELNIRLDGSVSPFFNIPISMWFTYVTVTMVGYGEISPVSYGGRVVAVFAGICGPIFLALPLFIAGSHFTMAIYSRRMSKLTVAASKSATVNNLLKMVNDVVGMELFKPEDQLPFLKDDTNLNSAQKIENLFLFKSGWFYLPYATDDTAGIKRLTQYKLFVLFGIFGRKIKKIVRQKRKQAIDLKSALDTLNQRAIQSSRPRTIKIIDLSDVEENKSSDFPLTKGSSSVNFMNVVSDDSTMMGNTVQPRRTSKGTSLRFSGGDKESYGTPRKLVEYCSFDDVKTNEPPDNSITRTDCESGSASLAVTGVKSYKPNRLEMGIKLLSEGNNERINNVEYPL